MSMQDRKDISVCMPGELDAAIKDHLSYGDSKSEWIREAIRQRLNQDDADAGPDTALEAHSSDSEPSESDSDSDSDTTTDLRSPDEQSTRAGGIIQRPK
jgi:Arc/MetJ-type ribon-helix-helix transcriptional regulator